MKRKQLIVTLAGMTLIPLLMMDGVHAKGSDNTLQYGEYGRPTTLDPVTSNDMISLRVTELIFNALVGIDEKQQIVPELAERWEQDDVGKTYRFYLRKDVKWHPKPGEEAQPFTADDVVFTYNIISHPKTVSPLKVRYEFIDKVKKIDEYTVEFELKRPVLNGLAKFSFKIIPKHGPSNPAYLTREDTFVQNPIGTGPYRMEQLGADREVVLVANEKYFKGKPKIAKIVSKPFADQNIMNQALTFNAIDMVVLVNPRHIPELQGNSKIKLQSYNALSYSFFGYNNKNPLLTDKRVRKAFTLAINREEMLKSFFNNQGTVISGPFAPGSWAYNLDVKPLPYSIDQAKALLAEAGFVEGPDGILQKDGKPLSLVLRVPIAKESESVKRVVLAFKSYLRKVGANIEVEFMEWQAWKEAVFQNNEFDIVFASWVFDDSADISSLFHSAETGQWKNNFVGYNSSEVDSLIVESKMTLDHEKRRTIYRKLHSVLADDAPYTFLWTLTNYAAYSNDLYKVSIHPYKYFSFIDGWYFGRK